MHCLLMLPWQQVLHNCLWAAWAAAATDGSVSRRPTGAEPDFLTTTSSETNVVIHGNHS